MEGTESKLLITLVGFLLLLSGGLWLNFFPLGGVLTAAIGLVVLVWGLDKFFSGSHPRLRA